MNIFQTCVDFAAKDSFFWFFALSGTALFIIQFALNFLGADTHNDIADGGDSGQFNWLSKQALTGFLMMFGWIGLTCRKEFDFSAWEATLAAFAGGIVSFFVSGSLFNLAKRLRSSGMVFRIEDTIGKQATVYQRIPKNGVGKISLSLNNLTYELDAMSHHPEELDSFTSVQIIKKADDKTVIVVPTK
ncbi:MAG: hypothetical protein HW387_1388 [Parachlamydiales bacterium]|nr:hypothetical protein [Parachlamydiales bacterium]